ncbi:MAG: MFS transporter [Sulfobacillus sp.]
MRQAFAIPSLRALWLGQGISQFGNVFLSIAAFWILQLRSPYLLVAAGVVIALPQLLAFLGGVLVDHFGAWRLMVLTDLVRAGSVALVLIGALADPTITPYLLLVALALVTLGGALFSPAESTLLPEVVSGNQLVAANGLMQGTYQTVNLVGAAVGGAALAVIGLGVILGFDAATFVISAASLLFVTAASRGRTAPADTPAISWRAVREGLVAAREMRWLIQTVPVIALTNLLFFGAFITMSYWVHHVLHGSVVSFGFFEAAFPGGAIAGYLLASSLARRPAWLVVSASAAVQGALMIAFALWPAFWPELFLLAVSGVMSGILNATAFAVIQRLIPEAMRGRVMGMMFTLFSIATPLGPLLAGGFFALHLSLVLLWLAAGAAMILLALVWGLSKDVRLAMAAGLAGSAASSA